MPLFDYRCNHCKDTFEILTPSAESAPVCPACGATDMEKLMGAPASISGTPSHNVPGPSDTGCCGSSPGHGQCAGPGSCCGKA